MNYDMKPIADLMNEAITKLDSLIDPCKDCSTQGCSDCCGAEIKWGDICSDCKEHCGSCCDDCQLK